MAGEAYEIESNCIKSDKNNFKNDIEAFIIRNYFLSRIHNYNLTKSYNSNSIGLLNHWTHSPLAIARSMLMSFTWPSKQHLGSCQTIFPPIASLSSQIYIISSLSYSVLSSLSINMFFVTKNPKNIQEFYQYFANVQ